MKKKLICLTLMGSLFCNCNSTMEENKLQKDEIAGIVTIGVVTTTFLACAGFKLYKCYVDHQERERLRREQERLRRSLEKDRYDHGFFMEKADNCEVALARMQEEGEIIDKLLIKKKEFNEGNAD